MSREDAPEFRHPDCCNWCEHTKSLGSDTVVCRKHHFEFAVGELYCRICNDYKEVGK